MLNFTTVKLYKEVSGEETTSYIRGISNEELPALKRCIFDMFDDYHSATFIDEEFGFENTIYNFKLCRHYVLEYADVTKRYVDYSEAIKTYEFLKEMLENSKFNVTLKGYCNGVCFTTLTD